MVSLAGTSVGAEMLTTVWRPRVRIDVPDVVAEVESKAEVPERGVADEEGREAEESPSHEGAMRARGEVLARRARCAVLVRTVVSALGARSAVGLQYASTVVSALMQGVRWVINLRARS